MQWSSGRDKTFTVRILTQIIDCDTNEPVYTHTRQIRSEKTTCIEMYGNYELAEAAAKERIDLGRLGWVRAE